MKYHSILTPALTSLCLLTSHNTLATDNVKEERWFEIEVILFKQIADNSKNTEQFSSNDLTSRKSRALDLLAPYLQPDITSLKQLLPSCEQQATKLPYDLTVTPYSLLAESDDTDESSLQTQSDGDQSNTEAQREDDEENKTSATPTGTMSVAVIPEANKDTSQDVNNNVSEREQEQDSQAQFTELELPVYNQYPISSKKPLCVIPEEFFQQHLTAEQLESYSVNGFPVDKLTTTINGLEQWRDDETGAITWASDSPYLISKDSLRLKSIASRIKRSRNYAPLLHLGWRQVGESKRKAKAMKLYAGEHLDLRYQQAMAEQENQQQALEIQAILEQREKAVELIRSQMHLDGSETAQVTTKAISSSTVGNVTNNAIESSEAFNELSITEELRQQAKQQQLDSIFQQFSLVNSQLNSEAKANELDPDSEIALTGETTKRIVAQLSSDIGINHIPLNANSAMNDQPQAKPPIQPWSIDGLFKVHLDHYLYIDTEFNIIEPSNASATLSAKQKLADKEQGVSDNNQVISFKQDRRVITGEIHYFDHPHIGMVVQIRRFDPAKPADEAVSQSKK